MLSRADSRAARRPRQGHRTAGAAVYRSLATPSRAVTAATASTTTAAAAPPSLRRRRRRRNAAFARSLAKVAKTAPEGRLGCTLAPPAAAADWRVNRTPTAGVAVQGNPLAHCGDLARYRSRRRRLVPPIIVHVGGNPLNVD